MGKIGTYTVSDRGASIEERERQIRAKELELEQRERDVQNRSAIGGTAVSMENEKSPNWPHPRFGYVHHDIEGEILEQNQRLVRIGYLCWRLMATGYAFNFVAIAVAAFHGHYYDSGNATANAVFTAMVYGGFAIPCSFLIWYWNLYKLCRKTQFSTRRWMLFQISFTAHIVFSVLILMGAPWSFPSAGILFVITNWFNGQMLSAAMGFVNVLIWAAVVMLSLAVLRVAKTYRNRTDESVQIAEKNDVRAEIRNAVAAMVLP